MSSNKINQKFNLKWTGARYKIMADYISGGKVLDIGYYESFFKENLQEIYDLLKEGRLKGKISQLIAQEKEE